MGVLLALFVSLLSGCVGIDPKTGNYSVIVPMKTIDEKIKKEFPVEKKIDYGTLTLENPSVIGSEAKKDKLAIKLDFKVGNFLFPQGIKGGIELTSGVRYDSKTQDIYLDNPMLDELKLADAAFSKIVTPSMRGEIEKVIAQIVTHYPIYNLKDASVASGFIKDVTIRESTVYINLGL
jgi:hypothetical protein